MSLGQEQLDGSYGICDCQSVKHHIIHYGNDVTIKL